DPLSYAPHWARQTAPGEASPASADARGTAGQPPMSPAPVERGAVARPVAASTPAKINATPPQMETSDGADVALPPLPRPFAGDVAIKELRRQLALDSNLVPQPPSGSSKSRSMSMSNSQERPAATQGTTQIAQRPAQDPKQVRGPALVQ